jgi:hypothetical protein
MSQVRPEKRSMAINPDSDVSKKHIKIWAADPLEKIFRSAPCPAQTQAEVRLDAARGEVVSGQIALRTEGLQQYGFGVDRVAVEPLRPAAGEENRAGRGLTAA